MTNPRRTAAERIYAEIAASRRIGGDGPFCEVLERIAEETGRKVLRHAAQVLRGKTGGRTLIDDRRALQRIDAWPAAHKSNAVRVVAQEMAGASPKRAKAIERRLRRKLEKINGQKGGVRQSAAS
jgi:hypothetical protein